jgi:hypothetical protein
MRGVVVGSSSNRLLAFGVEDDVLDQPAAPDLGKRSRYQCQALCGL